MSHLQCTRKGVGPVYSMKIHLVSGIILMERDSDSSVSCIICSFCYLHSRELLVAQIGLQLTS